MNRTALSAAALAAVVSLALSACGGPRGFGGGPRGDDREPSDPELADGAMIAKAHALAFVEMDADGDRRVTRAEFDAAMPRYFVEADADGSGALSGIEYAEWALAVLGTRYPLPGFVQMDTNADDAATMAEFAAAANGLFKRYDADSDGAVTRAELLVRLERGGRGDGPGGGGGRRPPGGNGPGGPGGSTP